MELTQEYLKTVLHYDPDTGVFRWACRRPRVTFGAIAGSLDRDGYRRIRVDRKRYQAHRLAIIYAGRELHAGMQVDHINGRPDDNRLSNLRVCTDGQNKRNGRKVRGANKFKGVTRTPWGFQTEIKTNKVRKYLGIFPTAEEAAQAYDAAATRLHGNFACTNKELELL